MENILERDGVREHYWINASPAKPEAEVLRVQAFCHSIFYPQWRANICARPNMMIALVLSGEEYFHTLAGDPVKYQAGRFHISDMNRNTEQRQRRAIRKERLERYFILLEINPLLLSLLSRFFPAGLPCFYVKDMERMRKMFEKVRDALASKEQDDTGIGAALFQLLCEASQQQPGTALPQVLVMAQRYIDNHFCEAKLDRPQIAGAAGVSVSKLSQLFRRHLNCTIREEISRRRMEKVKRLLRSSALSVAAIAEECGYTYSYYLAREFRKALGITPLQYRRLPEKRAVTPSLPDNAEFPMPADGRRNSF